MATVELVEDDEMMMGRGAGLPSSLARMGTMPRLQSLAPTAEAAEEEEAPSTPTAGGPRPVVRTKSKLSSYRMQSSEKVSVRLLCRSYQRCSVPAFLAVAQ